MWSNLELLIVGNLVPNDLKAVQRKSVLLLEISTKKYNDLDRAAHDKEHETPQKWGPYKRAQIAAQF